MFSKKSVVVGWACSYIIILSIPIIAIFINYYFNVRVIEKEIVHANEQVLENLQESVDGLLEGELTLYKYVFSSEKINYMMKQRGTDSSFHYDASEAVSEIGNYIRYNPDIELKKAGIEKDTADLIRKFHMERKVVVTSFQFEYICNIKEYAPELRVGLLTSKVDDQIISDLKQIRADEICPQAKLLTKEFVHDWHREGFRVRAWDVSDEELMQHVYNCYADGMTVNFPDKLTALIHSLS